MTTGEIIKTKRLEMNLTQEELAEKSGLKRENILGWETEISLPSRQEAEKLSEILKTDVLNTSVDEKIMVSKQRLNAIGIFAAVGWLLAGFFLLMLILR
ncbi:MAG: helix-turn-helix transcriptional regulator [Lachnospiraceae bacterium]|nr:helix-turn-helix transcriptional regulator [Lachnospiraceae bacterium]